MTDVTSQAPPSHGVFLRVKRRRNAALLSSLCVETCHFGVDSMESVIKRLSINEEDIPIQRRAQRRRSSLWKKVDSHQDLLLEADDKKKRSFRIVDAVFDESATSEQSKKRRRLKLVHAVHTAKITDIFPEKPKGYRVLNPVERIVDDSLKMTLSGEISCQHHFDFVLSDPRLASSSRTWLRWCNEEGGNLLHACAMWNDVTTAGDFLSRYVEGVIDAMDGEQRTPYDVAELCGHKAMSEILEAFGADTAYVYDLYRLDNNDMIEDVADQDIACELHNGYWDDRGELVVDTSKDEHGEGDDEAADDGDEDSNDENWVGNDYPEDEEWGESDSEEEDMTQFRHRMTHVVEDDVISGDDDDHVYSAHDIAFLEYE